MRDAGRPGRAMTCRVACRPASEVTEGAALAEVYIDLFLAGRDEDFRWLARSQGLSADRSDELWQQLARRLPQRA